MDWITSDTHFWHNNILKFPSSKKYRGDLYETREEMNEAMIKIWNSQVGEDDPFLFQPCGDGINSGFYCWLGMLELIVGAIK